MPSFPLTILLVLLLPTIITNIPPASTTTATTTTSSPSTDTEFYSAYAPNYRPMSTSTSSSEPIPVPHSNSPRLSTHPNHKVKIFIPCHYDLSQVETCAPFLDRYGGVVFVYDWNVAKDVITEYYRRQYPDGWVKVLPFSLRNIMDSIKHLDHRLDRYDPPTPTPTSPGGNQGQTSSGTLANGSSGSISSVHSVSSNNSDAYPKKQHQVVFLLTASMNPDYGTFGLTQKKILDAIKDALPERVRAVNIIGHCMYGCASCSGVEHKVPLYFTRYFNRSTSIIVQKPLIQLFHRLEQTGKWKFVWKMHPTSLHLDGYDLSDTSGAEQREYENVKFILEYFTVTQEEHACLLPFMEAFEIIITDLHSSVPFIATYFTPKIILSYFNDADYGTPERHQEFMDQLNTFVEPEELEALLNHLPTPKGDPSFFHSQYGHVDGEEDLRFGNLAGWPTEQTEPSSVLQYRQAMGQLAIGWKGIWKEMTEQYPDDVEGANNALGFDAKFPLLEPGKSTDMPMTLPRVLPRDRQAAGIELRVMSFNIWNGGLSGGHPLEQTAKAILASGADVAGLQECSSTMNDSGVRRYMLPELMEYLPGWYYSDQKLRSVSTSPRNPWGIVSKFPIVETTELGFGVKIQLNNHCHPEETDAYHSLHQHQEEELQHRRQSMNGSLSPTSRSRRPTTRFMYLFNCHLYYFPYQPFQLLKIPYDNQPFFDTAEQAVDSCLATRGQEIDSVIREIQNVAAQEPEVPIFLTGDFNEPSHLDWTPLSVLTGMHPLPVSWPCTEKVYRAGMVDLWRAYREPSVASGSSSSSFLNGLNLNGGGAAVDTESKRQQLQQQHDQAREKQERDVIERPGFTWTALKREQDASDHYDRIDFIFGLHRESSPIALKEVAIRLGEEQSRLGEKNEKVCRPWPSDHRAVVATVLL
ncbi:hypothetical protein BG000_005911 [Podila horticola]|nr:hypothetical protein BG000_005911 [Podila horticola]